MAGCQRKYLLWCSEGNEYRIVSDVYDYSERNWYKNQTHDWFREWIEKNPVLCEIIEDMFKAELVLAECEEEAATGAAMSSSMYNSSNSPR